MLSLQHPHHSHHRAPPASVTAPWFARPLLPPPRPSPEATASTVSAGGEDIEASFYEDDHVMVPAAAAAAAAMAASSFRNRYPERCYKRQQYQQQHQQRQQQQQQQQQLHQRLPTNHVTQCSSENSDEDDADDLPADPRTWLREDVQRWIGGLVRAHNLPPVDTERFLMNGKALCLMTMDMFCQRVPLGGKMLYKDFNIRLSMAMYNSGGSPS